MPDSIRDGSGHGFLAKVNSDLQLETNAKVEDTLAWVAREKALAFSASSLAITTDGTPNTVFILRNPSASKNLVISEIAVSCTTDVTITIATAESYGSGGTGMLPMNMNTGSAIVSTVTNTDCYWGDDITTTGTGIIFMNHVNLAMVPFREPTKGALLLGTNKSVSISLDAAAGIAFVSCKYYEVDQEI